MSWPQMSATSSLPLFRFGTLDGVLHAISTRHGGVSPAPYATLNMGVSTGDSPEHVDSNRRRFVEELGGSMDRVVLGRLRHGNGVTVLRRDGSAETDSRRTFESDGAVTDVSGLLLFLTFADCVPLLFWDRRKHVMGAAHAGWRGTALGIGPAVIETMRQTFRSNPEDIAVGIGPSIGPCCFTVGPEVLQGFQVGGYTPVSHQQDGEIKLDLWASNERQLQAMGIAPSSIENPRICSSCQADTYYSHRAERGCTGRFALCAGLV